MSNESQFISRCYVLFLFVCLFPLLERLYTSSVYATKYSSEMARRASVDEDAMLVRLIEEGLYLSHVDRCKTINKSTTMDSDQKYLVEQVFPTLVPALHDLLRCYKSRLGETQDQAQSNSKQPDPVTWLAQYLIRNNANHNTSRLVGHPFKLINDAVFSRDQSDI